MRSIRFRRLPLLTGVAAIIATEALAQEQPAGSRLLDEIVVTSSRVPLPLRQIGTSISVVTAERIEAHGNLALVDVLRQLPAISTNSTGGAGKATSLRVRGEEGFRTLTIFDGIRLSDPSGPQVGSQLEHMLSRGVDRVEILRGPQGLSYGADAGGIINVISRQDSESLSANFDAQTGAFATRQYSGDIGGGNGRADFFLSLANFATDGFNTQTADVILADDDGYENTTIHGRAGFDLTDNLRIDLVHRNVDGKSWFDGCWSGTTVHECSSTYDLQASRLGLAYDSANFTHSLAYASTQTDHDNLALGVSSFQSAGELNRLEYVGSALNLPGFNLVFGADLEEAVRNGTGRNNVGTYLEYLSDFSDTLFVTAGLRHDDNEDFGTSTSYRFSGAYLIDLDNDATLKFKSSYGTGFRAPSPYEIAYNKGAFASPPASLVNLRQETSTGYEFGVEYLAGDSLHLETVYFDQQVKDAIYYDLADSSGYLQDPGTSSSRGVELSGRVSLNESWNLSANYTHNDTERPNGQPRLRRPKQLANLGLSWTGVQERLNINAFYRISKDSVDQAGTGTVPLDNFAVLDLSASYTLNDSLQLYGRIENLADEQYQEVRNYNTPGRAAYVGIRLNFSAN